MSLINVDKEKCNKDGLCALSCPMMIIAGPDKDNLPALFPGTEAFCIRCGHCVSVCPTGALSHRDINPENCPPVNENMLLGPEQTEHFLRQRRSIRRYKNKSVDKSLLEKLISIARYAPSGHNSQPVKWLVIMEKEEVKRLTGMVVDWMRLMIREDAVLAKAMHLELLVGAWDAGVDVICRDAPHLITAYSGRDNRLAPDASKIALAYLELAATGLGLGTCWAGYFSLASNVWPPLKNALHELGLPQEDVSYGTVMAGFPKLKYHRLVSRNAPDILWR